MPNSEAEALHIRKLIEQSFDVWEAKQSERASERANEQRARILGGSIPAWVACALAIFGIVMVAGETNGKVNRNAEDIAALKQSDREQDRQSSEILQRLATIETLIRGDKQ